MTTFKSKKSKIYVIAGANAATGGPELLHQLVYNMRDLGFDAYMYYIPYNHPNPVHPSYKFYKNPYANLIEDKKENILIVPELYNFIRKFQDYRNIQKIIWWLSIDNFFVSRSLNKYPDNIIINLYKLINKIIGIPKFDIHKKAIHLNRKISLNNNIFLQKANIHFAQSNYALNTLIKLGVNKQDICYLSDYLNDDFLNIKMTLSNKENIVLYNPAKGYHFASKIIKNAPDINFVPIQNMNREQVIKLLSKAKVYIDFGNHPGKDRMPREAAVSGCCIITGKRGSAYNKHDIAIDKKYKFSDNVKLIPDIIRCIHNCINNYENLIKDFELYRNKILNEKPKFRNDLKNIMTKIAK